MKFQFNRTDCADVFITQHGSDGSLTWNCTPLFGLNFMQRLFMVIDMDFVNWALLIYPLKCCQAFSLRNKTLALKLVYA
jgi:hypothetical protein